MTGYVLPPYFFPQTCILSVDSDNYFQKLTNLRIIIDKIRTINCFLFILRSNTISKSILFVLCTSISFLCRIVMFRFVNSLYLFVLYDNISALFDNKGILSKTLLEHLIVLGTCSRFQLWLSWKKTIHLPRYPRVLPH